MCVLYYSGQAPFPCTFTISCDQYDATSIGYDGGFDSCCIDESEIPDSLDILRCFANSRIGRLHFSPTRRIKQIIGF
jgi:hypothetical protein